MERSSRGGRFDVKLWRWRERVVGWKLLHGMLLLAGGRIRSRLQIQSRNDKSPPFPNLLRIGLIRYFPQRDSVSVGVISRSFSYKTCFGV